MFWWDLTSGYKNQLKSLWSNIQFVALSLTQGLVHNEKLMHKVQIRIFFFNYYSIGLDLLTGDQNSLHQSHLHIGMNRQFFLHRLHGSIDFP